MRKPMMSRCTNLFFACQTQSKDMIDFFLVTGKTSMDESLNGYDSKITGRRG